MLVPRPVHHQPKRPAPGHPRPRGAPAAARRQAETPEFQTVCRQHRPMVERSIAWLTRGNRRSATEVSGPTTTGCTTASPGSTSVGSSPSDWLASTGTGSSQRPETGNPAPTGARNTTRRADRGASGRASDPRSSIPETRGTRTAETKATQANPTTRTGRLFEYPSRPLGRPSSGRRSAPAGPPRSCNRKRNPLRRLSISRWRVRGDVPQEG